MSLHAITALSLLVLRGCSQGLSASWSPDALADTLDSLDRGFHYLRRLQEYVNLDAILGARFVQGQLSAMLDFLDENGLEIADDVRGRIETLLGHVGQFCTVATRFVEKSEPKYYLAFKEMTALDAWKYHRSFDRDVDVSLIVPKERVAGDVHEHTGAWDDCFREIIGTQHSHMNVSGAHCQESDVCSAMMRFRGYTGYSLSHQVIYWELAKQQGCVENASLAEVDHLNAGFCANLYNDAKQTEDKGFPEMEQDIFMEIVGVCGLLGYRDFFTPYWLQRIIDYQLESGCWGGCPIDGGCRVAVRGEMELGEGCLSHKTAVAVFALSQYARFLVETNVYPQNTTG